MRGSVRNLQGLVHRLPYRGEIDGCGSTVAVSSDFRSDVFPTMIVSPWAHHRAAADADADGPLCLDSCCRRLATFRARVVL
jgi:hypothetical protein